MPREKEIKEAFEHLAISTIEREKGNMFCPFSGSYTINGRRVPKSCTICRNLYKSIKLVRKGDCPCEDQEIGEKKAKEHFWKCEERYKGFRK